jgi:hypothetical protein
MWTNNKGLSTGLVSGSIGAERTFTHALVWRNGQPSAMAGGMPEFAAFPWSQVPGAFAREGDLAGVEMAAKGVFDLGQLARIARELFALELEDMGVVSRRAESFVTPAPFAARLLTSTVEIVAHPEPALVVLLLRRLLNRPFRMDDPGVPPSPELLGAWAALLLEVGRRACRAEPPAVRWLEPGERVGPAQVVETWLRLDGSSFRVEFLLVPRVVAQRSANPNVPVQLKLVAGVARLSRRALESLRQGDAVLPGTGWFDPKDPQTALVAVGATEEHGLRLAVTDRVRYLARVELPHDQGGPEPPPEDDVLVRIEMGTITTSSREWSALQPGDELRSDPPTLGPLELCVAGQLLARGEFVRVGGEIGVRITDLADPLQGRDLAQSR